MRANFTKSFFPGIEPSCRLKRIVWTTAAVLTALPAIAAASIPDDFFTMNQETFWGKADEGHFADLLELHLVQYAADPDWRFEWSKYRYKRSGAIMEYGSTSGRRLYIDREITLNIPMTETLAARYDRRERQEERFKNLDQRFDGLWNIFEGNSFILSGWPTHEKKNSSLGLGWLWALGEESFFSVIAMDERPFFNRKTSDPYKFEKQPASWLIDGYLQRKLSRGYLSLNLGQPYLIERNSEFNPDVLLEAEGRAGSGSLGFELGPLDHWSVGAACRFSTDKYKWIRADSDNNRFSLFKKRKWTHLEAYAKKRNKDFVHKAILGYSFQNDSLSDSLTGDALYSMDAWLFGIESSYAAWAPLTINIGYLGTIFEMTRESDSLEGQAPPLAERSEKGYADKLQGKAAYMFGPRSAMEFILSKEVYRFRFGGAAVKAYFIF